MIKYLIINADDFGWDSDSYKSTLDLFEKNILTSATIMTDREATRPAMEFAKYNQKRFSFGLHFNIVDGHKSLLMEKDNSLTDNNGNFKSSNTQRKNALLFRLVRSDIQKELQQQLEKLFDAGIRVTHVDSHGHLHKFPQILFAMQPILFKYNIDIIRRPQNIYLHKNYLSKIENSISRFFFRSLKLTDYFFMLDDHKNANWFGLLIGKIKSGVTEIGIHPGTLEPWRKTEKIPFLKDNIHKIIKSRNIKLVNYSFLNT